MSETGDRKKIISVIMPALNEEENIPIGHEKLTGIFEPLPYDYEVIIIDNCSTDGTGRVTEEICEKDPRWRYVRFSRNFTAEISIAAGLQYCKGDAAVVLFSDLQDPPERIPDMIRKWEQGHDIVYGKLVHRGGDSWFRRKAVGLGYYAINKLSDIQIPPNATDFRLYDRAVIDALNSFHERNRYMRGFTHWVGFNSVPMEYKRNERKKGESKAPFTFLIAFTINAITTFSIKPLRLFSLFGAGILIFSVIMALVYLGNYLVNKVKVPGFTTTYLLLLLNLGVMSLGFGVLGEYIGNIYNETKRRPLWIVHKTKNIELESKVFPED